MIEFFIWDTLSLVIFGLDFQKVLWLSLRRTTGILLEPTPNFFFDDGFGLRGNLGLRYVIGNLEAFKSFLNRLD
ncbi:hypothetical protein A33Q_0442 [Indibacter alkaliphilus LW1]|uniref:Uncharacterized protein n=1 Tax=Indibacter alkaliphilus (strain CCUG 57479 / KCTC 22604 / LW1) TaxID=1189612 RepID=S2E583_INDAL|nr:hypothetical protein A33Q_0442 [Indibacter alkaliphilus LW1]